MLQNIFRQLVLAYILFKNNFGASRRYLQFPFFFVRQFAPMAENVFQIGRKQRWEAKNEGQEILFSTLRIDTTFKKTFPGESRHCIYASKYFSILRVGIYTLQKRFHRFTQELIVFVFFCLTHFAPMAENFFSDRQETPVERAEKRGQKSLFSAVRIDTFPFKKLFLVGLCTQCFFFTGGTGGSTFFGGSPPVTSQRIYNTPKFSACGEQKFYEKNNNFYGGARGGDPPPHSPREKKTLSVPCKKNVC